MHFKNQKWVLKSGCHGNGLIGTGLSDTPLSSSIIFYMKRHQISLQ